jgi:hypothetical protein
MVTTETEEIVRQQRVNEHKTILDMIALLDKRLSKIENDDKGTARNAIGDKALLSKLNKDVEDNRKNLYFVEDELGKHIKESTNGKN